ncbi:hypothetical protein [Paracoccus luteus]|uniref:hypothetical protein n=1 Tax=Paracoccus luteus TaxID=2508543 RepID=UPI001FE889D3|nr:hypothetical protein [Paracoccus luteus]
MRRLAALTGGLAAAALLTATAAPAQQPAPDPMAALREARPYDVLPRPAAEAEAAPAAAAVPAAVVDPMAAAAADPMAAAIHDPMAAAAGAQGPAAGPAAVAGGGAPDPELGNLPAGHGAEETYYQCVACHSTAIIRQQRITDARWDYLWHWMIDKQGMVEPDAETKDLILGYLKRNFSSER